MSERENQVTPHQLTREQIKAEFNNLLEAFRQRFGYSRTLKVGVVAPTEHSRKLFLRGDNIDANVPRGQYQMETKVEGEDETGKITAISFWNERILYLNGDTGLIHPDSEAVSKAIISHEIVHSQVYPRTVIGEEDPGIKPKDIRFGGELLYVTGFKAVSVNMRKGYTTEPTRLLDEYVTQYLAFQLYQNSEVYQAMEEKGLGIGRENLIGARSLAKVLERFAIDPVEIELFHRMSDIKGFLEFLENKKHGLGAEILRAGITQDTERSLKVIADISE